MSHVLLYQSEPNGRRRVPWVLLLGLVLLLHWPTGAAAQACGAANQSACTIFQSPPLGGCNSGLMEVSGRCYTCGAEGEYACSALVRFPSCNPTLAESGGRCWQCGGPGEMECPVSVQFPSCDATLAAHEGTCRHCGGAGEIPCPVSVQQLACDRGLTDQGGRCQALDCGAEGLRPCLITERLEACDGILDYDLVRGTCAPAGPELTQAMAREARVRIDQAADIAAIMSRFVEDLTTGESGLYLMSGQFERDWQARNQDRIRRMLQVDDLLWRINQARVAERLIALDASVPGILQTSVPAIGNSIAAGPMSTTHADPEPGTFRHNDMQAASVTGPDLNRIMAVNIGFAGDASIVAGTGLERGISFPTQPSDVVRFYETRAYKVGLSVGASYTVAVTLSLVGPSELCGATDAIIAAGGVGGAGAGVAEIFPSLDEALPGTLQFPALSDDLRPPFVGWGFYAGLAGELDLALVRGFTIVVGGCANCGTLGARPCGILERAPSCQPPMVESNGRCMAVPGDIRRDTGVVAPYPVVREDFGLNPRCDPTASRCRQPGTYWASQDGPFAVRVADGYLHMRPETDDPVVSTQPLLNWSPDHDLMITSAILVDPSDGDPWAPFAGITWGGGMTRDGRLANTRYEFGYFPNNWVEVKAVRVTEEGTIERELWKGWYDELLDPRQGGQVRLGVDYTADGQTWHFSINDLHLHSITDATLRDTGGPLGENVGLFTYGREQPVSARFLTINSGRSVPDPLLTEDDLPETRVASGGDGGGPDVTSTPDISGEHTVTVKATGRHWHMDGNGDRLLSTRYQPSDAFTRFVFERQADGSYRIRVLATGRYLYEGAGDGLISTRPGGIDEYDRFFAERQPDDSYRFLVMATGRSLHADGLGDRLVSTRAQETDDFTRFFLQ